MDRKHFEKRVSESKEYKNLLIKLENIVGNYCYNGNIQNYGPGGSWEGEGRWFRYPITLRSGDWKYKRNYLSNDIHPTELATGSYVFGANQLSIIGALADIIEYLEKHHDLKI